MKNTYKVFIRFQHLQIHYWKLYLLIVFDKPEITWNKLLIINKHEINVANVLLIVC